jgi:hypothetical protein
MPPVLVERNRAGDRDVQGLRARGQRDRGRLVAGGDYVIGKALPLGAEHVGDRNAWIELGERPTVVRDKGDPGSAGLVEVGERDAKESSR